MDSSVIEVIGGPDKPALQWAIAYPERETVHFRLEGDGIDAQLTRMDELPDGFSFEIYGVVRSGDHQGQPFKAVYSVETRSGRLTLAPAV